MTTDLTTTLSGSRASRSTSSIEIWSILLNTCQRDSTAGRKGVTSCGAEFQSHTFWQQYNCSQKLTTTNYQEKTDVVHHSLIQQYTLVVCTNLYFRKLWEHFSEIRFNFSRMVAAVGRTKVVSFFGPPCTVIWKRWAFFWNRAHKVACCRFWHGWMPILIPNQQC